MNFSPHELGNLWRRWPWKWPTLALLAVAIAGLGILIASRPEAEPTAAIDRALVVDVKPLANLVSDAAISKTATIEPALSAPLIARTGGRVTAIRSQLGATVAAGSVVVAIDTGVAANPTEAQAAGLSASLAIFNDIETAARNASDIAVQIAELNVASAEDSRPLAQEQAAILRRQADVAAEGARLALQQARDAQNPSDQLIASADLAAQAAGLAQDQATVGRQLTGEQTSDALAQARAGLGAALASRSQTLAELASQRQQLATQLAVAREQIKLAQVTAPVNGEVTSLRVRIGDFVTPGQRIGEINALEGAQVRIDVSSAVRGRLRVGDTLFLTAPGQEFTGEIAALASAPVSGSGLWQVDIFVTSTPGVLEAGDTVTVQLPAGEVQSDSVLIPLDVLTIRQSGPVIFTVNDSNQAREHAVDILGYDGDFAEAHVDLGPADRVIVTNNRTLRDGDLVRVNG